MSIRVSQGEAYIDGHFVAGIELHEEWIEDHVEMPLPGNGTGYKDLSHAGQAYVRFPDVRDPELAARLSRLLEFTSASAERKRAIRDAGQSAVAMDLVIGDRNLCGASVASPFSVAGSLQEAVFPIGLPR